MGRYRISCYFSIIIGFCVRYDLSSEMIGITLPLVEIFICVGKSNDIHGLRLFRDKKQKKQQDSEK